MSKRIPRPRQADAARMRAAIDGARPVEKTTAELRREIDAVVSSSLDAGSQDTMPLHQWVSAVLDQAKVSDADMERFVTRGRMHLWFHHGETVSGAVDMLKRFVVNGRREERADAEVDAMRGLVRAAVGTRRQRG